MNSTPVTVVSTLPIFEPDPEATYPLEVVAELTGISSQIILFYQQSGLIQRASEDEGKLAFSDNAVRELRRIEHLRACYAMNDAGVKILLTLMSEVEALRAELRHRHGLF